MGRSWAVSTATLLCLVVAAPASAQIRGLPVLLEPTEPVTKRWRLGLDAAFSGDAEDFTAAVRGTRLFQRGACAQFFLSGGVGLHDPPAAGAANHLAVGVGGRLVLGRAATDPNAVCPNPPSIVFGVEATRPAGDLQGAALVGIGKGHRFKVAGAGLEPWLLPHLIWTGIGAAGSDDVKVGLTAGMQLSSGAFLRGGGVRMAATLRGDEISFSFGPTLRF
jgi:hypothetical protein